MSDRSFHPYSPRDSPQPQALGSTWNASPSPPSPHDSDPYDLPNLADGFDFGAFAEENIQFFDSLPRLSTSPGLFVRDGLASRVEQEPPPSNQQAQPRRTFSQYQLSDTPDPFEFIDLTPPRSSVQASINTTRESSFIDLTESPVQNTHENMTPRKRKADSSPGEGRAAKSSRVTRATPAREPKVEEEVVDLVDIDDDEKYEDFKAKQQAEMIKKQQQEEATRPVKLAEFQCIICMDNPTDLTVTHCGMSSSPYVSAISYSSWLYVSFQPPLSWRLILNLGHLFCSECLHSALYAGTAKKCCPVCRQPISTTLTGKEKRTQPRNGIFVMEMKLMTAKKKGKQPVRNSR